MVRKKKPELEVPPVMVQCDAALGGVAKAAVDKVHLSYSAQCARELLRALGESHPCAVAVFKAAKQSGSHLSLELIREALEYVPATPVVLEHSGKPLRVAGALTYDETKKARPAILTAWEELRAVLGEGVEGRLAAFVHTADAGHVVVHDLVNHSGTGARVATPRILLPRRHNEEDGWLVIEPRRTFIRLFARLAR